MPPSLLQEKKMPVETSGPVTQVSPVSSPAQPKPVRSPSVKLELDVECVTVTTESEAVHVNEKDGPHRCQRDVMHVVLAAKNEPEHMPHVVLTASVLGVVGVEAGKQYKLMIVEA